MIHKNFLIVKNTLITVLKIIFGFYLFSLLLFIVLTLFLNIHDKIQFLTVALVEFLPFLALLYVFIAAFYLVLTFYSKIEIYSRDKDIAVNPTKIWDLQQNNLISDPIPAERHFPITKTMLIIPERKMGKKTSTSTPLPFQLLNTSTTFDRFFNIMRFTLPNSLESGDIVCIPYGGLIDTSLGNVPGDLYLQVKFLTRTQSLLMSLVQILTVTIPLIIFLAFIIY